VSARALGIVADADGALTAWIGESLGLGRCYLTDWLEHDRETITIWHGGAAPLSLCEPGAKLAKHFNIKKPACVEATIRAGMPMTLTRLWRCDGKYFLTAREGQTLKPRRHLMMTNGLARLDQQDPSVWFEELCHRGMPHHVALFAGKHEAFLRRFARSIGAEFV
jgi:L-fucose isomerase-like protein